MSFLVILWAFVACERRRISGLRLSRKWQPEIRLRSQARAFEAKYKKLAHFNAVEVLLAQVCPVSCFITSSQIHSQVTWLPSQGLYHKSSPLADKCIATLFWIQKYERVFSLHTNKTDTYAFLHAKYLVTFVSNFYFWPLDPNHDFAPIFFFLNGDIF